MQGATFFKESREPVFVAERFERHADTQRKSDTGQLMF
jgi:hypothetical protein